VYLFSFVFFKFLVFEAAIYANKDVYIRLASRSGVEKGTVLYRARGHAACFYSAPDMGAEYCDERVCVSVSDGDHISGTTRPMFIKFLVRVAYGRGSVHSGGEVICCILVVRRCIFGQGQMSRGTYVRGRN